MKEELEAAEKYMDLVVEFADSSVNIGMRYWVPTKQYFKILYQANLSVYKALEQAGITIPFPQRDIHMSTGDQRKAPMTG